MKDKVGEVFSIANDNPPVPSCTVSKEVHGEGNYITYFSLARNTDISAEIYPYHKLLIVADGSMEVYADTTDENRDTVLEAIDGCPVGSIREEE